MKRIFIASAFAFFSLAGYAQADSVTSTPAPVHDYSLDTMHVKFPAWMYGFLAMLSNDRQSPEGSAYVRRTAIRWNGTDTNQLVTTITTYGQFVRTYENQLYQADGIAADFNNELLNAVFPQAMRHPWVIQRITQIRDEFARRRQEIKEAGIKLLQDIKKTTLLDD